MLFVGRIKVHNQYIFIINLLQIIIFEREVTIFSSAKYLI